MSSDLGLRVRIPSLLVLGLGLGLGLGLVLGSCVEIDGGAVESGWTLRDNQGNLIDCAQAQLAFFRFSLEPLGGAVDPCEGNESCQFSCDKGRGITAFIIPEGRYAISLVAMGESRMPLGPQEGVIAPAPIERHVRTGEITDMNVNLIIVNR